MCCAWHLMNISPFSPHSLVACMLSLFRHVQLFETLWTVARQASLSMGILQAKILESCCHALLQGIFPTQGSHPGLPHCRHILYRLSHWEAPYEATAAKSLQSCPTLCDPIDSSPPGSPIPGILQEEHWSGLPFPSPMHESGN